MVVHALRDRSNLQISWIGSIRVVGILRIFFPTKQGSLYARKFKIPSLKLTASLPLKIGLNAPKGKDHLPTIHFQGRSVSFREGGSQKWWALENASSGFKAFCVIFWYRQISGGVRHPYHKRNAHTGCLGSLQNLTPGLDAIWILITLSSQGFCMLFQGCLGCLARPTQWHGQQEPAPAPVQVQTSAEHEAAEVMRYDTYWWKTCGEKKDTKELDISMSHIN